MRLKFLDLTKHNYYYYSALHDDTAYLYLISDRADRVWWRRNILIYTVDYVMSL